MVTNQEQINSLIRDFVNLERSQGKTSSTRIKNLTTKGGKQLDTLARLLTNKQKPQDICIAVFLKENGQLLVTSNLEEPEYAKVYLGELKEYIEVSSEMNHNETYKKLVRRAVRQIFYFIRLNQQRRTAELEKLEEFKLLIVNGEEKIEAIRKKAEEVYWELIGKQIQGWQWDYILPLIDTDTISNDIRDGVFDQGVIEAISKGKICYVKDKLNMHAEMKILNKLYDKKTKSFSETGYIGIAKLCCYPCRAMIDLVNSKISNYFFFHTCGTHASTYLGWIIPDFYQEEFIENLKRYKKWESSSDIPRMLPRNPYGAFQRDWSSIHRNFQNPKTKDSWSEFFTWSELKRWFELHPSLSPEKDLGFVLWMRDERKLDAYEASQSRLVRWKSDYQKYQEANLAQELQSKIQLSPK